jgi:hypothetical protein
VRPRQRDCFGKQRGGGLVAADCRDRRKLAEGAVERSRIDSSLLWRNRLLAVLEKSTR